jgi:hypothetical protein
MNTHDWQSAVRKDFSNRDRVLDALSRFCV